MKRPEGKQDRMKIPKSGRIGRLAKHVEQEAGRSVAELAMKDADVFAKANPAGKAEWLKKSIDRLEKVVGMERARKIMENSGRMCCGVTCRKRAQEAARGARSIEAIVRALNKAHVGGGRLQVKDKHTITGGYDQCYCGQVKHTKTPFPTLTYCYCSVGWYKQLFETALGKPVDVEITQSIISGAKTCEFIIHV
jgi:predicted ArsR family transcriptional regulator